jgi:hypothetical protein
MQKRTEIGGHDHLEAMNWKCVYAVMCAPPEWWLERPGEPRELAWSGQ